MANALVNALRLARAGLVFAQHGVRFVPRGIDVPLSLRAARIATLPITLISAPFRWGRPRETRVANALTRLGPSYIKLGQFLATRADVIGQDLAKDLSHLQDKLPPFGMAEARAAVERAFGGKLEDHYSKFGPPVAAASIAQVHKATVTDGEGAREVAVKILRPGVERRFKADLDSYFFAARMVERWHEPSRRLRPVAVVENLRRTTDLEMDLRLEAAAISEMAENIAGDHGLRVPKVDWKRTARQVMTLEWIDGIPISDRAALVAAGHDPKVLGLTVMRAFLRHAMRDGFFHADMHQGNLFVEPNGTIVAVDFGIMGRLGLRERRFLAEILHGLITRDYYRAAAIHFEAGYVPPTHSIEVFAQAMRAIGEPIHGRTAEEISMADLLGQLFAYTELFDMQTRPELILLQKSMVIVEGVARSLDPTLNVWSAAEPVAREWVENNLGLTGQMRSAGRGLGQLGRALTDLPDIASRARETAESLQRMASDGWKLDAETVSRLAREQERQRRGQRLAMWTGALSLLVIAVLQIWR